MVKGKKNSDSESGEVKEDDLTESEKERFRSLTSQIEKERFFHDLQERREAEQDRKRIMQESLKQSFNSDEKLGRKRPEIEPRVQKKMKVEEVQYNHRSETGVTLADIEKIRISRDQLAKWCNHIFFEDTVRGTFVRINIGPSKDKKEQVYLMCEVADIVSGDKVYEIEGKIKTDKQLYLKFGKSKKNMKFDIVSNTPFTEKEFAEYMRRLEKDGMKPVTQCHIQNKENDIKNAINYKYKREDIDQLVEKQVKESLKRGKVEATAILELDKLKVQLEDLRNSERSSENNEKIKSLEHLVQDLEKAIRFDDKIVESDVVQRVNERNRCKQLEIDSKRAEEKKRSKVVDVVEIKPSIFPFEIDQLAKKRLIDIHSDLLDIDSSVLANLKAPVKEYSSAVFPHPQYKSEYLNPTGKEVLLFEDWKRNYNPN